MLCGGNCKVLYLSTAQVRDEMGNQLGGKKAAMQFVHESIYGKSKQVHLSIDDMKDSTEDGGESEKENSFDLDNMWKLSEELKTLEAALESLQGNKVTPDTGSERVVKEDSGEKEENKEKLIEEDGDHGASNDALGEVDSNAGVKLENTEVEKESLSRNIAVDEKSSLPRSQKVRLTERGMKGRRKSLAGLRDEV